MTKENNNLNFDTFRIPENAVFLDLDKDIDQKQSVINALKKVLEENYRKIESVDLKFDVTSLKKDMENKTSFLLNRTFKSTRK